MESILLIAGIVFAAAGIGLLIWEKVKKSQRQRYYRAANKLIREQHLEDAIRNGDGGRSCVGIRHLMVALKVKGQKGLGYVFDPTQEIRIGRNIEDNDVCLQDLSVSAHHCSIFLYENHLCVKDFGSANGTIIKSGFRRRETLYETMGFLQNKSRLWVGSTCFIITVFYCETAAN